MGKVLIIKSADFSANAVAHIEYSEWEEIDLSDYDVVTSMISSLNQWTSGRCVVIPTQAGQQFRITANAIKNAHYAPLASISNINNIGQTPTFATGVSGRIVLNAGSVATVTMPSDAQYLYVLLGSTDNSNEPSSVEFYNP